MNSTVTSTPAQIEAPWLPYAFALGTLAVGMVSAVLSFMTAGAHSASNPAGVLPSLWPPAWVFWLVWIVIYPCAGVATWRVWRQRRQFDVRGALVLYGVDILGALFFLPLSNLTANSPAVLTLLDANGLLGTSALAWLYSRYEKAAVWWLLPFLVWMPLTLTLKAWLWILNP